jgi:hypothetical protein
MGSPGSPGLPIRLPPQPELQHVNPAEREELAMTRWRLTKLLVALHLALVIAGAASLHPKWSALSAYGQWTGSSNSYGFFAPSVSSMVRVRAVATLADGSSVSFDCEPQANALVRLRAGTIAGLIPRVSDAARRALAACFAARVFSQRSDVADVEIVLESLDLPTSTGYRAGERERWTQLYSAQFARRDSTFALTD